MSITIEKPNNANYCGIVVELKAFQPLDADKDSGKLACDRLKSALIFGNSVIVGKDTPEGTKGVFFPVETALSAAFLSQNSLYRKAEYGNIDPEKTGMFDQHGRVRCVKFRGHKSEGFWCPIEFLDFVGASDLPVGAEFDKIGETEICRKYIPRSNRGTGTRRQGGPKAAKLEDKIVDGQFRFHIDTANLRRNIDRIYPNSLISVSEKWHGTSAIFANILVQRDLPWYERLLKRLGVKVQDSEYGFTWASRRVVKGINGEAKAGAEHYYSTDVWAEVGREVQDKVQKGFTLYGEIVGFTSDGSPIQGGYHYGCQPGTHRFLVYRITQTNPDGIVSEMGWEQMRHFCRKYGLEMVKTLFYGHAQDLVPYATHMTDVDAWRVDFMTELESRWVGDRMCPHNGMDVPGEGIVTRLEKLDECDSYKLKSGLFLQWETRQLDADVVDMETLECCE